MKITVPEVSRQCFQHHLSASYFTGARFGIIRLIQVIAAVHLGAGAMELAWIAGANGIGLIASLFIGSLLTQHKALPYLVVPSFISNVALLLIVLVSDLQLFVLLVCLHGFFDTCTLPAMGTIQRQVYPQKQRGGLVGYIRTRFMLCGLISGALVAELLELGALSHRLLLPVAGVLGFVACFHYLGMRPQSLIEHEVKRVRPQHTLSPFRNVGFICFTVVLSVFECAHLMIQPLLPGLLMDLGVNARGMVWFFAIIPGFAGILTFAWWGRQIDRYGVISIRACGSLIYACEPLILILAPILFQLSGIDMYYWVMLAALCRGMGLGAIVLTWSLSPLHFSSKKSVGQYIGVHNCFTGLRTFVAPLLGALCFSAYGLESVFITAAGLMGISSLGFYLLTMQLQKKSKVLKA